MGVDVTGDLLGLADGLEVVGLAVVGFMVVGFRVVGFVEVGFNVG